MGSLVQRVLWRVLMLLACACVVPLTASAQPRPVRLAVSQAASPIALGPGPTRIPLAGTETLAARLEALGPDHSVYLVVSGLRAAAQPGVVYDVFLTPAETRSKLEASSPWFAGTLNFFAARGHGVGHPAGQTPTVSLNVTAVLRRLLARGAAGPRLDAVIVPEGRPAADARPAVESVALVAQ